MRSLILAAAVFSLSGCGLLTAVTYASYAAEVVRYLTTGKSVSDQRIAMEVEKDCVPAHMPDGAICIEEAEGIVPQEVILQPIPVATTGDGSHPTPQKFGAEMVSPSGSGAATARRPAEAPISFALYFSVDSDRLSVAGQTAIDAALIAAQKIGATDFAVTGHAELFGPDTRNIKLSLRRAKVVSEALVARGIDPTQISIANQVEVESTIATAGDLVELASRRVDIILLKQD